MLAGLTFVILVATVCAMLPTYKTGASQDSEAPGRSQPRRRGEPGAPRQAASRPPTTLGPDAGPRLEPGRPAESPQRDEALDPWLLRNLKTMSEVNDELQDEGREGQILVCNVATWSTSIAPTIVAECQHGQVFVGTWLGEAAGFFRTEVVPNDVIWAAPSGHPEMGMRISYTADWPWTFCDTVVADPRLSMPE